MPTHDVVPAPLSKYAAQRVTNPKPPGPAVLSFAPKQQEQFKQRTTAVAWLAAQADGYVGTNVTATITRDLARHGYKVDQADVKGSMDWLVWNGWALAVVVRKRTTEFMLDPDVTVPEPVFVTVHRQRGDHHPRPTAAPPARRPVPPLPTTVRPGTPPWLAALVAQLTDWWRTDPDQADQWAAAARDALGDR